MASAARVMREQWIVLVLAMVTGACERKPPPPAFGGGSPAVTSPVRPRPPGGRLWDDSLGPAIATVSAESGLPVVFMRDSLRVGTVDAELFSHDTLTVRVAFDVQPRTTGCAWHRMAQLKPLPDGARLTPWSLALSPGIGRPIAVEAIGELAPRDSSSFAIQMSRLASALPDDSISAPFRGLPVVVREAWRLQLGDGTLVAVAVAIRSKNVESDPRAEILTLIGERDRNSGSEDWRVAWARRDAGPEDRIEGADLLAALQLRNGHAVVVFVREGERGLQVEFVERLATGSWRTRWSSAVLSCENPPS